MKNKKLYSLEEQFEGRVKRLSLHIQDAGVKDEKKPDTILKSATIFGTLQLFKKDDKKNVENINFTLPLNHNTDLKNHLVAIIAEAVLLKEKSKKNAK